jgi:hypothetical protein
MLHVEPSVLLQLWVAICSLYTWASQNLMMFPLMISLTVSMLCTSQKCQHWFDLSTLSTRRSLVLVLINQINVDIFVKCRASTLLNRKYGGYLFSSNTILPEACILEVSTNGKFDSVDTLSIPTPVPTPNHTPSVCLSSIWCWVDTGQIPCCTPPDHAIFHNTRSVRETYHKIQQTLQNEGCWRNWTHIPWFMKYAMWIQTTLMGGMQNYARRASYSSIPSWYWSCNIILTLCCSQLTRMMLVEHHIAAYHLDIDHATSYSHCVVPGWPEWCSSSII